MLRSKLHLSQHNPTVLQKGHGYSWICFGNHLDAFHVGETSLPYVQTRRGPQVEIIYGVWMTRTKSITAAYPKKVTRSRTDINACVSLVFLES